MDAAVLFPRSYLYTRLYRRVISATKFRNKYDEDSGGVKTPSEPNLFL